MKGEKRMKHKITKAEVLAAYKVFVICHTRWMRTSVFTKEGRIARRDKNRSMEAWKKLRDAYVDQLFEDGGEE